jgi:hypothetical protein
MHTSLKRGGDIIIKGEERGKEKGNYSLVCLRKRVFPERIKLKKLVQLIVVILTVLHVKGIALWFFHASDPPLSP